MSPFWGDVSYIDDTTDSRRATFISYADGYKHFSCDPIPGTRGSKQIGEGSDHQAT